MQTALILHLKCHTVFNTAASPAPASHPAAAVLLLCMPHTLLQVEEVQQAPEQATDAPEQAGDNTGAVAADNVCAVTLLTACPRFCPARPQHGSCTACLSDVVAPHMLCS
jgi:hypothetical protein